jgi:hypothetical protein
VAGHDGRGLEVAAADHLEQRGVGFRVGVVAGVGELVDDEQPGAAEEPHRGGPASFEGGAFAAFGQVVGSGEVDPVSGVDRGPGQPDGDHRLAGAGRDGDRLHYLRSVLPMQARVVAATHPLFGQLLHATAFKRWNGVLHLVVTLPDGSPGTIPAAATSVWDEPVQVATPVVLDLEGLRELRRRVELLAATRAKDRVRHRRGK